MHAPFSEKIMARGTAAEFPPAAAKNDSRKTLSPATLCSEENFSHFFYLAEISSLFSVV